MNVEEFKLVGKMKYPIVHAPRASKFDPVAKFSVVMECTDEQYKKLLTKGLDARTKLRIDPDDGRSFINLTAKASKADGSLNEMPVIDSEGKPIDKSIMIGNGSSGEAMVMLIHQDSGSVIMRLKSLMVTDLKEFKPEAKVVNKGSFDNTDIL